MEQKELLAWGEDLVQGIIFPWLCGYFMLYVLLVWELDRLLPLGEDDDMGDLRLLNFQSFV